MSPSPPPAPPAPYGIDTFKALAAQHALLLKMASENCAVDDIAAAVGLSAYAVSHIIAAPLNAAVIRALRGDPLTWAEEWSRR